MEAKHIPEAAKLAKQYAILVDRINDLNKMPSKIVCSFMTREVSFEQGTARYKLIKRTIEEQCLEEITVLKRRAAQISLTLG